MAKSIKTRRAQWSSHPLIILVRSPVASLPMTQCHFYDHSTLPPHGFALINGKSGHLRLAAQRSYQDDRVAHCHRPSTGQVSRRLARSYHSGHLWYKTGLLPIHLRVCSHAGWCLCLSLVRRLSLSSFLTLCSSWLTSGPNYGLASPHPRFTIPRRRPAPRSPSWSYDHRGNTPTPWSKLTSRGLCLLPCPSSHLYALVHHTSCSSCPC